MQKKSLIHEYLQPIMIKTIKQRVFSYSKSMFLKRIKLILCGQVINKIYIIFSYATINFFFLWFIL